MRRWAGIFLVLSEVILYPPIDPVWPPPLVGILDPDARPYLTNRINRAKVWHDEVGRRSDRF